MKDYTIGEATKLVVNSFALYDKQGTQHWAWEDAAHDLSYQIGTLNKIMLQMSNRRWAENKSAKQLETEFEDELADILAEVLYIAHHRGINMNKALDAMAKSDQKKVSERS